MQQQPPPFAVQRILCLALVIGMSIYMVMAAVVLQSQEHTILEEPLAGFDIITLIVGGSALLVSLTGRMVLTQRANRTPPERRAMLRFAARLFPIAVLEFGGLLAITGWLLHGTTWPYLGVAGTLLAVAVALVPFTDVDEV